MTRKRKSKPISLRAYARSRKERGLAGGTPEAVSKAAAEGRLRESIVVVNGKPKIADAELADREWQANTQPRVDHPRGSAGVVADALLGDRDGAPLDVAADYFLSRALRERAAVRREAALADMAEIDAAERRGDLVLVEDARAEVVERYAEVRTKLLGLGSKAKQRLQHLTADDVRTIDDLVREALEAIADADDEEGDGGDDEAEADDDE